MANAMSANRAPLIATAIVLVLGGSCVGYPVYKLRWTARVVNDFCASVHVGDPIDGLAQKARSAGLDVIESPPTPGRKATLMAWQGWMFARRFCDVEHEAGRVTGAKKSSLD